MRERGEGEIFHFFCNFPSYLNIPLRLLDSAVVLLEGGGEEDLSRLQENGKDTKEDALNLTSSLFLKALPPSVTRAELHTLCSKFPGYLRYTQCLAPFHRFGHLLHSSRLCITDPDSSKQWQRRAWVTFRHNTPVREICYSLNNTKLRGSELRSLVNKPLSQRIRVVSPIYWDSRVARAQVLCLLLHRQLYLNLHLHLYLHRHLYLNLHQHLHLYLSPVSVHDPLLYRCCYHRI